MIPDFHVITSSVRRAKKVVSFAIYSSPIAPLQTQLICTKTRQKQPSFLRQDQTDIANNIITILTKNRLSPNDSQLDAFAPKLTPKVVEAVLTTLTSWRIAYSFFQWASYQHGYKHNGYTYNAMASILSHARQNAPLRALATEILNSRCSMSPGALGFFIRCLGGVGLADEANAFFDQVRKMGLCIPNNYSYNCLIEVNCKFCSIGFVDGRLKEMLDFGWKFDKYTLTPVLQLYSNAGEFDKALKIFNQMHDQGWADAHILSILLVSLSKKGEVDKVFDMVERMENSGVIVNEKTFCVLIHGFAKESSFDKALQLYDKMRKLGHSPNISIFDVLIGGLCKNNEISKALCLHLDMLELGIPPDVGILTKLVSSVSNKDVIIRIFQEGLKVIDADSKLLLYNSVLNNLVNNGMTDKAHNLLLAVLGVEHVSDVEKEIVCPDTASFTIVINALMKLGRLDASLNLFRDMGQTGSRQNKLLYNNLIDGLCNSDRLEEGFYIFREMKELGLEPTSFTYNSIYGCLCKKGDGSRALDLLREMRVHGHEPWIKHSTLLVKQLCKHGKEVEACEFLSSMVQEGFLPDMISYSAAISGLIKSYQLGRAFELFRSLSAHGFSPDVVANNILINGLCKANKMSEAEDVMNDMILKGLVPSIVTYNQLINGWCKNGDIDHAMSRLSRMSGEKAEPNVITYTSIIDGLCNAGRPDDAIKLWYEMGEKGCIPNRVSFMAFIHGLCKCNKTDAALIYFHEMKHKEMEPDTFVYVSLMSAFLAQDNPAMAVQILKEMVNAGKFPLPFDKHNLIVRDSVFKLSEDARTSLTIKELISEGSIPNSD